MRYNRGMWATWIRPLADADASCGAKAHGLARLIAAGLPVPDGLVIEPAAFDAIAELAMPDEPDAIGHVLGAAARRIAEAELPAALVEAAARWLAGAGPLAVRSSASIEDRAGGAAPGVMTSVIDVAPGDVWRAVREVWTSALTPLAVAYARRHRARLSVAVIVQRFVPGARTTIYTRPIGAPAGDEVWRQRGGALRKLARGAVDRDVRLALVAEAAIDAGEGADVELVGAGDALAVVQARPMIHPVRRARRGPPPIVLAPLRADGRRWTWDITHNPDPLSPAQAGLVDRVDRSGMPYAARVCGGYLYVAPGDAPPAVVPPADAAELAARIAAIEARFVVDATDDLAEAVARYVGFVRRWARELSPLVAAARAVLLGRLAHEPQPEAAAARLIGPRRAPRDGVMSPAWDVAVPTYAERPDWRAGDRPAPADAPLDPAPASEPPPEPPAEPPPELAAEVALARAAADAAEHDDLWFAGAQWLVRRALLARGQALGLRGDDVFWLPLDELIAGAAIDPDDAQRRAAAARAVHARAAEWDMPRVVRGEAAAPAEDASPTGLRGTGFGPRVVGRVVRFASLAAAAPVQRGDIVVVRAITPALAMLVEGCAALVSETGGLLDHGAAMARELGIPCVVGCAHAWSQLTDGDLVEVNGDEGSVIAIT
ncbi:MAG TPA: PEP-utilizing enzyme [Kofleriaceae bacterium]